MWGMGGENDVAIKSLREVRGQHCPAEIKCELNIQLKIF